MMVRYLWIVVWVVGFVVPVVKVFGDGLFVTLQTTMGDIRIELEFEQAPRTCANFLSLVEGTRAWVDLDEARPKEEPFYTDIIFHRVISNFVIQAGSPNGTGNDGPGYRFNDEFSTNLRHDASGTVSMANSGPNSNGSQFFITLRPTPELDFDKVPMTSAHAVFGYVVEGMDVVSNIGVVATSGPPRNKPVDDIAITNHVVTRMGAEANEFDVHAVVPPLPSVHEIRCTTFINTNDNFILDWEERTDHEVWLFASLQVENEQGWVNIGFGGGGSLFASHVMVDSLVTNNSPIFFSAVEVEVE